MSKLLRNRRAITAAVVALVALLLMCAVLIPVAILVTASIHIATVSTLPLVGTRYAWISQVGDDADGNVSRNDANYAFCHNNATGTVDDTDTEFSVGQNAGYYIYRGMLYFNVSIADLQDAIASKMSVASADVTLLNVADAELQLTVAKNLNDTDFVLTLQNNATWTHPASPLADTDYSYINYATNLHGTPFNTTDIQVNAAFNITLTAAGCKWVNDSITGSHMVTWALRSNRDIASTTPTGLEMVSIYSSTATGTKRPTLFLNMAYSLPNDYVDTQAAQTANDAINNIYSAFSLVAIVPFLVAAILIIGIIMTVFVLKKKQ